MHDYPAFPCSSQSGRNLGSRSSVLRRLTAAAIVASGLVLAFNLPSTPSNATSPDQAPVTTNGTEESTCDPTPLPLESTSALSGGGTLYSYDLDGMTLNAPVPPNGFQPLTASAAQLAEYDFPPRPSSPADLATWQNEMSYATTPTVPNPSLGIGCSQNTTFVNGSWSGWNGLNSSDTNWVAVQGEFSQPASWGCAGDAESSWVGLGGGAGATGGAGGLIQKGTSIYEDPNSTYAPFYEVLNSVAVQKKYSWAYPVFPGSPSLPPGNGAYLDMSYDQSNTTAYFWIENTTTGNYLSTSWDVALGILQTGEQIYDGSTADWVDEWPSGSGGMADYYQNNWSDAYAELGSTGGWQTLGSTNPENDYIYTNHYVSDTSSWSVTSSTTSFQDDWWNCN